jgi:hypothetical protein
MYMYMYMYMYMHIHSDKRYISDNSLVVEWPYSIFKTGGATWAK